MTGVDLPLESPGFRIREYREDDAENIVRLGGNYQIWRHLGDAFPFPYTHEKALAWLHEVAAQDPTTCFAIADPENRLCGGVGVMLKSEPNYAHDGEIGYWLGRQYWNQGIATAAVRAFTAWVRAAYGLQRVSARVFATNTASARVLQKCGFRLEGTLRQGVRKEDRYLDLLVFGHLPGDGHSDT